MAQSKDHHSYFSYMYCKRALIYSLAETRSHTSLQKMNQQKCLMTNYS